MTDTLPFTVLSSQSPILDDIDRRFKEEKDNKSINAIRYNTMNELLLKAGSRNKFFAVYNNLQLQQGMNKMDGKFNDDIYTDTPNGYYFIDQTNVKKHRGNNNEPYIRTLVTEKFRTVKGSTELEKYYEESIFKKQHSDDDEPYFFVTLPLHHPDFKAVFDLKKECWRCNMLELIKVDQLETEFTLV